MSEGRAYRGGSSYCLSFRCSVALRIRRYYVDHCDFFGFRIVYGIH